MPITSTSEIRKLVEALGAMDAITREAAIARLAVIGRRAVDRLAVVYADPSTSRQKRIAILRVMEATEDPRALAIARGALSDGGDVAIAAIVTLHALLDSKDTTTATAAMDALVATAVDGTAERLVRVAAADALQDLPGDLRARVAAALADDPDEAVWQDALNGRLPENPATLRRAIETIGREAPLSSLHKLVDAIRRQELDRGAQQQEWRAVRGALHQTLALRGSSVALYDLRETVSAATGPLPSTYLAAMQVVGDELCLEAIAAALCQSGNDERWRLQLTDAFRTIVKRLRLPAASGTFQRIRNRWPDAARALNMPSRTTVRRTKAGRT